MTEHQEFIIVKTLQDILKSHDEMTKLHVMQADEILRLSKENVKLNQNLVEIAQLLNKTVHILNNFTSITYN